MCVCMWCSVCVCVCGVLYVCVWCSVCVCVCVCLVCVSEGQAGPPILPCGFMRVSALWPLHRSISGRAWPRTTIAPPPAGRHKQPASITSHKYQKPQTPAPDPGGLGGWVKGGVRPLRGPWWSVAALRTPPLPPLSQRWPVCCSRGGGVAPGHTGPPVFQGGLLLVLNN